MMYWWNLSKQQNTWIDVPIWGQRDYRLHPLNMVILSTEEEVEVEEEENGLQEIQMDRPNGGFGRGYSQGNDVGAQQAPTDRPQPDRPRRRLVYTSQHREKGRYREA